jgi:peptidoglycan/xylan/chitin deacetylase (PgdA/CDA1 family)
MYKTLFAALSPAGPNARLSVLIFHRVLSAPDPLFPGEPDAVHFDAVCGWLARWFNVLPLDMAVQRLRAGTLPARAAAITFDDGYADNHDVAMPILRRHGLCATFFIATGFLDGGRMWNDTVVESLRRTPHQSLDLTTLALPEIGKLSLDGLGARRSAIALLIKAVKHLQPDRRAALVAMVEEVAGALLPTHLMMSSVQVKALRDAGMQIGAHTVNHPILARLDRANARREMAESKETLQTLLGERVELFAYPNGRPGQDFSPESVSLTRELGFEAAFTTARGVAKPGYDPFQLPRFTPWDRTAHRFGARLMSNLWHSTTTVSACQ